MDVNLLNYDINEANFPSELPPPNEWMIEFNMTLPETVKALFSVRLYVNIRRDGRFGAMG